MNHRNIVHRHVFFFKTSCRWKVNEIFFLYNSSPNAFSFADDTFRKYTWNCIGEMNNMTRVVYRILSLPSHLNKIHCNMVNQSCAIMSRLSRVFYDTFIIKVTLNLISLNDWDYLLYEYWRYNGQCLIILRA